MSIRKQATELDEDRAGSALSKQDACGVGSPPSHSLAPLERQAVARQGTAASQHSRDRQELRIRVVASLVDSGYAALALVGCDVEEQRVVLSGSVPSYHLKQLAQVYVQRVEGIGEIDNRLEVRRRGRG